MGEIKGMSLVEDTPAIDPNMLFNYMGEMEEEIERLEGIVAAKKKMVDDAPKTEEKKETKQKWDVCDTAAAIDTTNGAAPAEDTKEATNLDKGKSKAIEEKPVDKKDKKSRKKAQSKDKHSKSKDGKSKKKTKKEAPATPENIIAHGRILLRYLNEDYKSTKASLFPLLDAGLITFDLLWALFKPNTLVYTVCPGTDEPRAFIVEFTEVHSNIMRGTWLAVEGRYLEFVGLPEEQRKAGKIQVTENDGKGGFGWGKTTVDIDSFTGSRRIDTLRCYPMKYRPDAEEMKRRLIERGRKFVTLAGMQYKNHKGLAFLRNKKGQIVKLNLNGRIMIDPALFRRMNPNYIVSSVRPRSADLKSARELNVFTSSKNGRARRVGEESDSESEEEGGCCGGDEEDEGVEKEEESKEETVKYYFDESGNLQVYNPEELVKKENEAAEIDGKTTIGFSDEEFMLASSVVLGFSFPEKLWLEISVAGVSDIIWNDTAFDTLVLPNSSKEIVKALVETHTGSRMESTTIDDIIQGKGRGLVSVLHGPPGTGKTLTAESIAELLHKPLYMVSSGELGTTAHVLEEGLNRILDIAHTWDAVLLLDEADVFLEKRTMHDLHRNALVSVFLRLLEYFQGILFLTTNRVQSFDEAFQSRIHVALRYDDLTFSAKKQIWTNFINMVFEKEKTNGLALLRRENAEKEKERREKKGTAVSSSSSSVSSRSKGKKGEEESMLTDAILSESDVNMLATKSFNGRQVRFSPHPVYFCGIGANV
ncbi:hypothetical protein BJ508DRAFT_161466 [Ascobolus immersus RN42]|uniref:AAA+ ATPase domain-containing protein n=1 Tax=Ascobolus immersus RN42 TaxID=1160509 RepID=A0A3N4HY25_ASCIM|nr:hypothetical protein BJ508DRAFT_161466 [Ascobolus immersus RN42]